MPTAASLSGHFDAAVGRRPSLRRQPLEDALNSALAAARERWPRIALEGEAFAAALGTRVRAAEHPDNAWQRLHSADLFLAAGVGAGDERAMRALESSYFPALLRRLRSRDSSHAFADDVLQKLREQLFMEAANGTRGIQRYSGEGTLAAWLAVCALRIATRLKQRDPKGASGDDALLDLPSGAPDPELALLKATYRAAFRAAFDEALRSLTPQARALLRLAAVDGLSGAELARMQRVSPPTMSRWLAAARTALCTECRRILAERLKVSDSQLDSLAALVLSHLRTNLTDSSVGARESGP